MSETPNATPGGLAGIGRFLEIQNLGLNLPFAIAFLLIAADGLPSWETIVLVIIAFVAARNAGHSFNRWADRRYDAANPRTQQRALVTGRASPGFALAFCAANAVILVVAAYFLNPLAFALSPVALAIILGYSYTKRFTSLTTPFLGLVEAITPAAMFIAVQGALPPDVLLAVGGLLLWGTAFETIHSLGDVESDRELGLFSLPRSWGVRRSVRIVPVLHGLALGLLFTFGLAYGLTRPYYLGLVGMAVIVTFTDIALAARPTETRTPFRWHFVMSTLFLAGSAVAVFLPYGAVTLH